MLKDLTLEPVYESPKDDIGVGLYNPLFSNSVSVDRTTCFFSSKALSRYSEGLEKFARNGKKYRLIVSKELKEEDFKSAQKGYEQRKGLTDELMASMRERITLDDRKNLANLANLIAAGVVDIKMAFVNEGIFHPKFGIATDLDGSKVLFNGSPNDTKAAIEKNFEVVETSKSWSSEESSKKIDRFGKIFDELWENKHEAAVVLPLDKVILKEIEGYDNGRTYSTVEEYVEDSLFLDLTDDGKLVLSVKLNKPPSNYSLVQKSGIYSFTERETRESKDIPFKPGLTYVNFKKIIDRLENYSEAEGYRLIVGDKMRTLIREKEFFMEERSRLGVDLKQMDKRFTSIFENYKQVVDSAMVRKLRDKQMWDSFYMYTMARCGNFSVPGAGKTASVLGVFAYLRSERPKTKLVVVGPLSSFKTWEDEFNKCFGENIALKSFNTQSSKNNSVNDLRYNTGNTNLFLFNYEGLSKYVKVLKERILDKDTILVFDEVHRVKNPQGVRAKDALELSQDVSRIVIMTGTPIPNSYEDLQNPLKFMFSAECEDHFGTFMQKLSKLSPIEREELNDAVQPFFCRTTKSELGVPLANDDVLLKVGASAKENMLLEKVKKRYLRDPLGLIIRTLQLESDPKMLLDAFEGDDKLVDSFGDWDEDHSDLPDELGTRVTMKEDRDVILSIDHTTKTKKCIEHIKGLVAEGKNVIVWCIFKHSMANIEKLLKESNINVYSIHGGVEPKEREQIMDRFASSKATVLVTNPHTLAESVSLHATCHDAVYFEYSYNLVHLLQSKDRIHRLGLPSGQYTQYHFLQSVFDKGISLDNAIYERLEDKEQRMLAAIDADSLEEVTSSKEDIERILHSLGWDETAQ